MKIMALRRAFFNGSIIRTGEILDIKGNTVPSWAKKIDNKKEDENANANQKGNNEQSEGTSATADNGNAANININVGDESVPVQLSVNDTNESEEATAESTAEENVVDELADKTEEELLEILNKLIDETVAKGITLENAENKTVIEQIKELQELVK